MSDLTKSKILVVNDTPDQLEMMETMLRRSGHLAFTAADGSEAIELVRRDRFDLIISDVSMPGMNGIEFCRLVRADRRLSAVPLLLVSAIRKDTKSAVEGLEAGADDYIEAPFDPERLLAQISRLLKRKAFVDEIKGNRELLGLGNFLIRDLDDCIISWNRGAQRLYGYTMGEALGQKTHDLLQTVFPEPPEEIRARLLREGEWKGELWHRTKGGTQVCVVSHWLLHRGEQGEPAAVLEVNSDVTEKKQWEEQLRFQASALSQVHEAVVAVDAEHRVTYWNAGAERLYGVKAEDALGWSLTSVYQYGWLKPEDELHARESLEREGSWLGENLHTRPDGRVIHVESTVSTLKDESGASAGMLAVIRDVTERKRTEAALLRSQHLLQSIIDNATALIYVKDIEGRYLLGNRRHAEIFGLVKSEVTGKTDYELFPEEVADNLRASDLRVLQAGAPVEAEEVVPQQDGDHTYLSIKFPLFEESGAVSGVCGISTDITERLKVETALKETENQLRQAQKMEAVGRLAGGVAHDFNNLLTAIKGYSELTLRKLMQGDPLRSNVEEIQKAAGRAANLTRQLLAFSRRQVLQPRVLDLNVLVTEINKMLPRVIGEDIELVTKLGDGLGRVKADPGQIEQVILNLAVNARDAMPEGGHLTILTANASIDDRYAADHLGVKPGQYVMLSISDEGVGMDEETRKKIFEPFFTTKGEGKGTGLGLSTVYGIVKQSGGNIWVYSEVGQGATFKIYLPRVEAEGEAMTAGALRATEARGTETVLLVEDDDLVRGIARAALDMAGYKVLDAPNGGEALLKCEQYEGEIALVLTDVVMPGINGRELARRLCGMRPNMGVLFMSGYTEDAIVHHGVLDSGTDFIEKPFTPDSITRKVREVLDRKTVTAPSGGTADE